jgi:hypothetical protein
MAVSLGSVQIGVAAERGVEMDGDGVVRQILDIADDGAAGGIDDGDRRVTAEVVD